MAPVFEITLNLVSQASEEIGAVAAAVARLAAASRAASSSGRRSPVANIRSNVIDAAGAIRMLFTASDSLATLGTRPNVSAVTIMGWMVEIVMTFSLMRV